MTKMNFQKSSGTSLADVFKPCTVLEVRPFYHMEGTSGWCWGQKAKAGTAQLGRTSPGLCWSCNSGWRPPDQTGYISPAGASNTKSHCLTSLKRLYTLRILSGWPESPHLTANN